MAYRYSITACEMSLNDSVYPIEVMKETSLMQTLICRHAICTLTSAKEVMFLKSLFVCLYVCL